MMDYISILFKILSPKKEQLDYVLIVIALVSSVLWYSWHYYTKQRSEPLPPRPWGLPVVGNLPFLKPELHTYFQDLAKKHGPIFKLRLGAKLAIVANSSEAAREMLRNNDVIFANHDVPAVAPINSYGGNDIAWSPYGPRWRMLRKLCTNRILSKATLDSSLDLRRKETRRTVWYLADRARVGSTVNLGEQIFLMILNVTTQMLWGTTVEGEEREIVGAEFLELVSEMNDLLLKPNDNFLCQPVESMAQYTISHVTSPQMAEGIAIREAIKAAKQRGWRRVHMVSDAKEVIEAIQRNMPKSDIYGIVSDVLNLATDFENISFSYVAREHNNRADKIAKTALRAHDVITQSDCKISYGEHIPFTTGPAQWIPNLFDKPYNIKLYKDEHLVKKVVRAFRRSGLIAPAGILTSLNQSGQQWDYPNGWAPVQEMIVTGLARSDPKTARELAEEIARSWIKDSFVVYKKTGSIHEKLNVVGFGQYGGGGGYKPQTGFGWSNGVILAFLDEFGWPSHLQI